MTAGHLISRVTILGTGLIGGSFALALKKYTTEMHVAGWDRAGVLREARSRGAIDETFTGDLAPALRDADLIYIALPSGVTLDQVGVAQRGSQVTGKSFIDGPA